MPVMDADTDLDENEETWSFSSEVSTWPSQWCRLRLPVSRRPGDSGLDASVIRLDNIGRRSTHGSQHPQWSNEEGSS